MKIKIKFATKIFAILSVGCFVCAFNGVPVRADDAPNVATKSFSVATIEDNSTTVDTAANSDSATNSDDTDSDAAIAKSPIQLARVSPNNGDEFIQIANFANEDLPIESLSLKLFNSNNSAVGDFTLSSGKFLAGHFILLSSVVGDFGKNLPDRTLPNSDGAVQLFVNGELADEVCWGLSNICGDPTNNISTIPNGQILQNIALNSTASNPLNDNSDFTFVDLIDPSTDKTISLEFGGFVANPAAPIASSPNLCAGLALNEIAANNDQQFIELKNTAATPTNISGCQLQTNRSSKTFAFGDTTLTPGALLSVNVPDTGLTLTKTTSGKVYLLSSDGQTEIDEVDYANLKSGTSFANFADGWKQTYDVTPGAENIYEQYLPCASGYERNFETGNCNKIATPDPPKICQVGYFLNEQTNRCNKIAAPATPKICADGYFLNTETNRCNKNPVANLEACAAGSVRNSLTNRCNKIATTSTPTPCKTGWERNPTTNRCRKIASDSSTDYPVNAMKKSSTETNFVIGAIAILVGTALLVLWQFREEIGHFFRAVRVKLLAKKYYNEMSQLLKKDR